LLVSPETAQDILDEAAVEHATAKDLIAQLQEMDAGDELFDAKLTVLGEYINHHVEEEQGEMFRQARKAKVDMDSLGEQLQVRKDELMAEMGLSAEGAEEDTEDDADAQGNQHGEGRSKRAGRGSSRSSGSRHAA
jgi:hypothetical protein